MSEVFAWPLALAGLVALPALVYWHRRARPDAGRLFSAFFLLPPAVREGLSGRRFRAPFLLIVRLAAALMLVLLAASPTNRRPGTLVLTAGPLTAEPGWAEPVTYVRAGHPPTVADEPTRIAVVAGRPDWSAALLRGRREAPEAPVVFRPHVPHARIVGAGAEVVDGGIVLVVQAEGLTTARLVDAQGEAHALAFQGGLARFAGRLPAGPAVVQGEGADPHPLCVPDARPIPVAETGFAAEAELDTAFDVLQPLGLIERVPLERSVWRPAASVEDPPARFLRWAPFSPDVTRFSFPDTPPTRGAEPLLPVDATPAPGAVVRAFSPLAPAASPTWYAGDAVVADAGQGLDGRFRRFGFWPAASDLPETAAWPVHLRDIARFDQRARVRCRAHAAGAALTLSVDAPLEWRRPDGRVTREASKDGLTTLDGLDEPGLHRLTSGDEIAWVAVNGEPAADAGPPSESEFVAPPTPLDAPVSGVGAAVAVLLLLTAVGLGRRVRSALAWAAVLAAVAGAFEPRVFPGAPGTIVVAVDSSGSMPARETLEALTAVEGALGAGTTVVRVMGDDQVRRVGPGDTLAGGGATRASPLLHTASQLAGPNGAVIYLSDGHAPDLPVAMGQPVFPLQIRGAHTDAAVLSATASRLGDQLYVRSQIIADAPTAADVEIDRFSTELDLEPGKPRTVVARIRASNAENVVVRVQAHDDTRPGNDRRRVPIEGAAGGRMVVVARDETAAAAARAWGQAAGFEVAVHAPAALGSDDPGFWGASALVIHDVPAEQFPAAAPARLTAFVRGGGMLLFAGRAASFGPGGWAGRPWEALSPVTSDPRPPGAGRLALVLLLDRSGSMAAEAGGLGAEGVGRLARGLAAGLRPVDDRLGIVAFGTSPQVLQTPVPAGTFERAPLPVPAVVRGGTLIRPALATGLDLLQAAEADARVLVVVTDGKFADGGEPMPLDALRAAGVRLLVVLVGGDVEPAPLEDLAQATGGTLVIGRSDEVLRLSAAGVGALAGGGLLAGPGAPTPGSAWGARIGGDAPRIEGRVRVRERPTARVLARVDGEPLLAEWQVGAGRVAALATDAWSLSPAGWAAFFAPARAGRAGGARLSVEGGEAVLWVPPEISMGAPTPARLVQSDGAVRVLSWRCTGPGQFRATLPAGGPLDGAPWTLTTDVGPEIVTHRFAAPLSEESRPRAPETAGLEAEAALTGGAMLDSAVALDGVRAALRRGGGRSIAPILFLIALVALMLDVAEWAGASLFRRGRGRGRWPRT